jgi:probable phosphoglycerate mutase
MRLLVTRHGQTDWNLIRKLQGITDIPLNDTGRQMAIDAREKYKDLTFSCCYCSPLERAYETATIFLEDRDIYMIDYKGIPMIFQKNKGLFYSVNII